MDRLELLRELEELVLASNLTGDELRLYILFLSNCVESGNGEIDYRTITNAMGKGFSQGTLSKICRGLSARRLIKVTSTIPERATAENFILTYSISLTINN